MIIGNWWANKDIELVSIDGKVYALNGWNGDKYISCWECTGDHYLDFAEDGREYEIKPIYQEDENGDFEIIGYEVY